MHPATQTDKLGEKADAAIFGLNKGALLIIVITCKLQTIRFFVQCIFTIIITHNNDCDFAKFACNFDKLPKDPLRVVKPKKYPYGVLLRCFTIRLSKSGDRECRDARGMQVNFN